MTILKRNSQVYISKGHLRTQEINEFNPQTMTRVYSYFYIYFTTQKDARVFVYKSNKRNVILNILKKKALCKVLCEKQSNLLLAKI